MSGSGDWAPHTLREHLLEGIDAQLALKPDDLHLHCDRARLLAELGRAEEARLGYLSVLAIDPTYFRALNNLGALIRAAGSDRDAHALYAEAVSRHPEQPIGHINIGGTFYALGNTDAARAHYEKALEMLPDSAEAHRGLSHIFREIGDVAKSNYHRRRGYAGEPISMLPYRGSGQPISVLMLVSAYGGNLPFRPFLNDHVFRVTIVVAEFFEHTAELPPHQLFINAISDADLSPDGLQVAMILIGRTSAPVINHPANVLPTGRASNAQRLAAIPGVITPKIANLPRTFFADADAPHLLAAHGLTFPLLLRAAGHHTGRHFVKVDSAADLAEAAERLPGRELLVLQFLDARSADQKIRKYRVMSIDRVLYPTHAAISRDWKVHFFSADMADNPEHRAEDEAFLTDMPAALGPRVMSTLENIRDMLGLDYFGIDFSVADNGEVLVYEANGSMTVRAPPPGAVWAYRESAMRDIHNAISRLLLTKLGVSED